MYTETAAASSPFPEDRVLYLATRQEFTPEHAAAVEAVCRHSSVDWESVLELAVDQHVAPLIFHNLEKVPPEQLNIPADVLAGFKRARIDNILMKKDARQALELALRLFNQAKIEIMLVKGAALNLLVYTQPWYTLSWDIDLVTRLRRPALNPRILDPILDQFSSRNESKQRHITKVEYDFYTHHDVTVNGLLPVDIDRLWADGRLIEIDGGQLWVMAPEDLLITAAISALRKRYFRLKNLCDIAEIIYHYPQLDWDLAAQKCQSYQCEAIMYTALKVSCSTLGAHVPDKFFESLRVNPLQAAVINRLVLFATQKISLKRLSVVSGKTLLGRQLSWPLALSYASYQPGQVLRVIGSLYKNRNLPAE